jgi:hypothetical protein
MSSTSISVVVHFSNNANIPLIHIGPILKKNAIYNVYHNMVYELNVALKSEHEYYFMYNTTTHPNEIINNYIYGFKTFEDLDRDFGVPSSNEYHFYAAIDLTKYRNPFTRKKKAKPSRRTTTSRTTTSTANRRRRSSGRSGRMVGGRRS